MKTTINETQWKVFKLLLQEGRALSSHQIAEQTEVDHTMVMGALLYGQEQKWLTIREEAKTELIISEGGAEIIRAGFPERRILQYIPGEKKIPLKNLSQLARERDIPMNEIIKWGSLRGWFIKEKGDLVLTPAGEKAVSKLDQDEEVLQELLKSERLYLDDIKNKNIEVEVVKKYLGNRQTVAKLRSRTIRLACLSREGIKVFQGDDFRVVKEKNLLTSEDITTEGWRDIELRPYDISLEAEKVFPAKIHPMQKIIQQTRKAFLEMGFSEIISPQVESAFWDFDALFQPQDHPARDMQDTFYISRPCTAGLPEKTIVERVKQTHEDGWETGSTGWGYQWEEKRARQVVLRTHTTAATIRALKEDPNPPRKVFCVGKVYRNEAISYKHLPEFFQVDGIIIDEKASLATLLGTLREFYRKMGFDQVRFKPSFFPYTEPSAEVFVYMESKQSWIELGGSGVFRPEVTLPLGCKVPVLAWGLGLDRLAMLRYGFTDIRELYWSDLDKINEVSLCR